MSFFQIYKKSFSGLSPKVWVLSLAMLINRSGSMVLLFTSLYLTKELHYSLAQAGWVMSLYGVGSILGSYTGGWLTDKGNFYDIMISSLIICACVLFSMVFVTSLYGICIIIFLYAFTADTFRPANSSAIAFYSQDTNRTRSVSLVRMATNLGFTIGPAVGGFVAHYLGYKWLFVIDASTSIFAACMLMINLPRRKIGHDASNKKQELAPSAYKDYWYLLFIFLVAVYATCFFQIFASVPQYFSKVWEYDEDKIGLILALNGFLVVLIEMPLIMQLENNKNKFKYIIWGALCLPISFFLLLISHKNLPMALLYTFIITMSEIYAMPFMMNIALSRPDKSRQGQYAALYSIAYGIANIAAPLIGLGIAARYGFTTMFYVLIAVSLILTFSFYQMNLKRKVQ
jgi:predicted MFS family arabinose efflux permease